MLDDIPIKSYQHEQGKDMEARNTYKELEELRSVGRGRTVSQGKSTPPGYPMSKMY